MRTSRIRVESAWYTERKILLNHRDEDLFKRDFFFHFGDDSLSSDVRLAWQRVSLEMRSTTLVDDDENNISSKKKRGVGERIQ